MRTLTVVAPVYNEAEVIAVEESVNVEEFA